MRRYLCVLVVSLLVSLPLAAQSSSNQSAAVSDSNDEKGFASYILFGGSSNSSGRVFKLDSSIGYNFNAHVGFDIGLPIYFAHASTTNTGVQSSNNGIGNPYLDLRFTFRNPVVSYRSIITGYFPVASVKDGFSTGRMTADWTNHFEHSFSRLTPFVDLGIGNTVRDTAFFNRPFTSLGFNTHIEGGASLSLSKQVDIGASAYSIVPSGQQTVYSKLMNPASSMGMSPAKAGGHGRVFETTTQTTGTADLTRDHGFSAWIAASPNPYLDLQLGYTRSAQYALDTVAFDVGVNVGRLVRKKARH